MVTKTKVYFAKTDALSGSLVETLRQVNPTIFFAVPRIFEKFEERIKTAIETSSLIKRKVIKWAMKVGSKAVDHKLKNFSPTPGYNPNSAYIYSPSLPFTFPIANFLLFSRIRAALGLNECKIVAFGAAPLKKSTIDFFKSLNIPLFNNYGMSETTGPQCLNLGVQNINFYSCGKSLAGTDIKIENPNSMGVGEIFFRGRNRFMGYFKDEVETTKSIDKNGFIHSGDLGFLDPRSNLIITGRKKELIVTAGGENVAPIPIEESIKESSRMISNVIVIGDNRPYLIALMTLKSDLQGNLSEDSISELNKILKIDTPFSSVYDILHDEKLKNHIGRLIESVNEKAVSRAQKIRKWVLIPQDFTIEGGELTSTHKLKRNSILQKYSKYVEGLYSNYKF